MGIFTRNKISVQRKESIAELLPLSTGEFQIPAMDSLQTGGHDVNLILMVKEHAPRRLENIDREVKKLQKQMQDLQREAEVIGKLYEVVKHG